MKNFKDFEITGVHLPSRKGCIIQYCFKYDEIELKHEKGNKFSNRAILIKNNGFKIGYIPEYQVEEFHKIICNPFTAFISNICFDGSYLVVGCMTKCTLSC